MASVFTIFNHGTDFHRDKNADEVISILSSHCAGGEARVVNDPDAGKGQIPYRIQQAGAGFLICEGPGSDEVDSDGSGWGVRHAHPGKYNPFFGLDKDTGLGDMNPRLKKKGSLGLFYSDFQDEFMGKTESPWQTSGRIYGTGWRDNVVRALFFIANRTPQPTTVNLIGWSRGAVTCHMMAHKLFEVYARTIKVNICVFDPIIGGKTDVEDDMVTLQPNVENYLSFLALDDARGNFQPVDRDTLVIKGRPRCVFLPMPGNHASITGETTEGEWPQPMQDVADLGRWAAWAFLDKMGTAFQSSFRSQMRRLRRADLLAKYQRVQRNLETIRERCRTGWGVVSGSAQERAVRTNLNSYRIDSGFVNDHHWGLQHHDDVFEDKETARKTQARLRAFGLFPAS